MSHNYPHRQLPSDTDLRPEMGSYNPADLHHNAPNHDDFYRPSQEPSSSFSSLYTTSSSTRSSQASHWTMDGAMNILSSCGLNPSDLSLLAELPENILTVESLPHVLQQIKGKRGTVKPFSPPDPSSSSSSSSSFPHSSTHQHTTRDDLHSLSSTTMQYSSLDPVSRGPLSSDQVQDWQDPWRNTRTVTLSCTSRPDPPPSSSSLVVDYDHKPATSEYGTPSVATVPAPACPTSGVKSTLPSLFSQLSPANYRPAVPSDIYKPKKWADCRPPGPETSTTGKRTKSRWDIDSTSFSTGAMPSKKEALDFHGTSPTVFPYSCSLCDITVLSERVWNTHVNGTGHADGQLNLLQKFPKWDCRMESVSRDDNQSEKRKDEGKPPKQDSKQQANKQTQIKTTDKGKMVSVNFPSRAVDEPYLRKLTEPFGKIEKITMFPSLGFVELGSADQASNLVKYYSNCPQTVKGQKIEFRISKTFNMQQSSKVMSFRPAPPGKNGQSDLLSICRRFGQPVYTLFLPSVAFVELKNISETQKLVDYYSSTDLKINNTIITVSFSTEYSTFMDNSAAKRCGEETPSSEKRPRSSSLDKDETLSTKRRQMIRSKDREEERKSRRSRSREQSSKDEKGRSTSRGKMSKDEKKRSRSKEKSSNNEKNRSRSKEKSSKDEKKRSTTDEKSNKDEKKKSISEEKSSKDEKKNTTEEKTSKDNKKNTTEVKSNKDEKKESMTDEKSMNKEKQHISEDNSIKKTNSEDKCKKDMRSRSVEKTRTITVTKAQPHGESKPEAIDKELTEEEATLSEEESDIEGMEVIGEDLMEVLDEAKAPEEVNTDPAKEKRSTLKDKEASGGQKREQEEEEKEDLDFPFDLNNCITLDEVNEDESEDKGKADREAQKDSTSRVVYITQLPLSPYTDAEFIELVKNYGKAERYFVARRRRLGFIQMSSPSEALKAIEDPRNRSLTFHDSKIRFHLSKKYKWLSSGLDIPSDKDKGKEGTRHSSRRRSTRANEKVELDKTNETSRKTQKGESASKKTENKDNSTNKKSAEKERMSKKTDQKDDSANKKSEEKETTSKKTEKKYDSTNKKSAEKETTSKKTDQKEAATKKPPEKETVTAKSKKESVSRSPPEKDTTNRKSTEKELSQKSVHDESASRKPPTEELISTQPPGTALVSEESETESVHRKSLEKQSVSKNPQEEKAANQACGEEEQPALDLASKATSDKPSECLESELSGEVPSKNECKQTQEDLVVAHTSEQSTSEEAPEEDIGPPETCQEKTTKRKGTRHRKMAAVPQKKPKNESVNGTDAMETELASKEEEVPPQTDEGTKPPDCSMEVDSTRCASPGDLQSEQETAEPAEDVTEERKPSKPVGTEFVRPVVGYFCKLCQVIYVDEDEAKLQHCSSLEHYNKYQEQTGKDPWMS